MTATGWEHGRAVPDRTVAVLDGRHHAFDDQRFTVLAHERWGKVNRLLVQLSGDFDDSRVPSSWDLEVNGHHITGMTTDFYGGPWGNTGFIAFLAA